MNLKQIEAELRLFKAFTLLDEMDSFDNKVTSSVEKGLLYERDVPDIIKETAERLYGIKPEQWNNTFHKSFGTVIDTPIEKLIAQQILHYFTTYGLESVGLYDSELVYIPHEKLEIPEIEDDIPLIVIKNIDEEELSVSLMTLLTSGIALSKQTVEDIMCLSDYINKEKFDEINNKEIKIALYEKYNIVPKNNMSFLRYLVYKLTGSTLLIKSKELLKVLSDCDKSLALELLQAYVKEPDAYKKLGEIFLSQDEFFVAIKSHEPKSDIDRELNHIINRIRKSAKLNRKRMAIDIVDRLSSIYDMSISKQEFYYNPWFKSGSEVSNLTRQTVTFTDIENKLNTITIFREIRIVNALRYRLANTNVIMYKIRNGKAYLDDLINVGDMPDAKFNAQKYLLKMLEVHLYNRVHKVLANKTIFLPSDIEYAVPTSEKQFLGSFPIGTSITIPRENNMVIGVHWNNLDNQRVDLDLHAEGKDLHIGWNASYKDADIVFSGDVTDAPLPNGATECLLIKPSLKEATFVIKLKNFTQNNHDVPYELIIASTSNVDIEKNYTINPNNIITSINTKFDYDPKCKTRPDIDIAWVTLKEDSVVLTFNNTSTDASKAGFKNDVKQKAIKYGEIYPAVQLKLSELLESANCILLNEPYTEELEEVKVTVAGVEEIMYRKVKKQADYNLSKENVTKDIIISMFTEV